MEQNFVIKRFFYRWNFYQVLILNPLSKLKFLSLTNQWAITVIFRRLANSSQGLKQISQKTWNTFMLAITDGVEYWIIFVWCVIKVEFILFDEMKWSEEKHLKAMTFEARLCSSSFQNQIGWNAKTGNKSWKWTKMFKGKKLKPNI